MGKKMEKKFNLDRIVFVGRSYDEYMKMFDLDLKYLKNKKILDCPAGASSFTAELSRRGYDVIASDILYNTDPSSLEKKCENDLSKIMQALSGNEDMYIWKYFRTPGELKKHRITIYQTFIRHYRSGKYNRYNRAELPNLPFKDNEFSLVLSSLFLFLYDDRLDYAFHRDSIQEMLRISKEIRIFPLIGLNGKKSSFVDKILADDLAREAEIKIKKVPYEFMLGGNEMMKITK
jgi:ubiquinone/menaquinone biosynthesis C-methylase UbiE